MKRVIRLTFVLCLGLLVLTHPAIGQFKPPAAKDSGGKQFGDSRDHVKVSVVPESRNVAPGSDLPIAIILEHDRGWHSHTNDPKVPKELGDPEDYIKTQIFVEVSSGSSLVPHAEAIQWPVPHVVKVNFGGTPVDYSVFNNRAIIFLPVTIPADAPLGTAQLIIKPVFQTCDEKVCLRATPEPPKAPGAAASSDWINYGYEVSVQVVAPSAAQGNASDVDKTIFANFDPSIWPKIHAGIVVSKAVNFDLFGLKFSLDAGGAAGLLLLLLVSALGGFLLNFTPCVLPVIPIKIISLAKSGGNRRRTFLLGTAMFLGVLGFWMALGLMIATIRGFTATNQLFQYPLFTIGVGVIIAIMAVGMCGLFAIRLPQFVYFYNPGHDTYHGSFMFGIMTAILSTPCTAPFMGAAAAWAATQNKPIILLVFFSIGFGMGLPYFILSGFPRLVDKMPRTGPASELIKQLMGLLMLAAAAYFVGVGISGKLVAPPEPPSRLYLWVVAAFVAAGGAWLAYRTMQIAKSTGKRIFFGGMGIALVLLAIGGGVQLTDKGPIDWTYYTPDRLVAAQSGGKVVVMEFTAEWCLNCKALEKTVLRSPVVAKLLAEKNVVPIKVDLTGDNSLGNQMLTKVQRLSIPLLVVFAPDGREVFKGDYYTVDQVVAAVREAQGKEVVAR